MKRRQFLGAVGAVGVASTAGCMGVFQNKDPFYDPEDFPTLSEDTIVIHWFYQNTNAQFYDQEETFLKRIATENPEKVAVIQYPLEDNDRNLEILDAFREDIGVESEDTPVIIVDGLCLVGFWEGIQSDIEDRVDEFLDKPAEAQRYEEVMSQFFDLENPEKYREEPKGLLEGIRDWISNLV